MYPGAGVDILSGCAVAHALYGGFPNVRHVYRLPTHIAGHLLASTRTLRQVRGVRYDLVIDPDPQSHSGRLLALWARSRHSLGFVGPRKSGTLTHGVALPACVRHKAKACVYLLRRAAGEDPDARPYPAPTVYLTKLELALARGRLAKLMASAQTGLRIGVFANATGGKRLARGWWHAFIDALRVEAPGCEIVEILPGLGRSLLGECFPCFYSSDVRKLAAMLACLDGFVSADCGVMHLAWAAGAPTVGLFHVTDPREWGPFGQRACALDVREATPSDVAARVVERLALAAPAGASRAARSTGRLGPA